MDKIAETSNPLGAPAASLDRLAIHYKKYGYVLISPMDKESFIKQIVEINPKIEVILRNDNKSH